MKATFLLTAVENGAKRIPLGLVVAAALFLQHNATAQYTDTVKLGKASDFAVLAGAGITVAGAVNSTTITGDIGTYPTPSITGLGNVVLHGANQTGDAGLMLNAQNALKAAYDDAAGRSYTTLYGPIYDLGNQELGPGVYQDPSQFLITGTLTLNAHGDPNSVWIFQAGSSLTAEVNSTVLLTDGAQSCHVFWQVTSEATLDTGSTFVGNILALQAITLDTGATVDGRVLARNAAVSLDYNTITKSVCNTVSGVPDSGSTLLLLGSGVAALFAFRRRFLCPA
ncbi:MAG: VPDSG-CTERM sorting domain-containing protein [Verrucomicrobiota bacterium]|jgi:hypothetical protein